MNSEQFEKYQIFTEKTINHLSQQVTILEKKLDMFTNLLEISKYINQYIKDPNLFPLINDMLIGVFGAKFSTIFIKVSEDEYEAVAQNVDSMIIEVEKQLIQQHHEDEFIINDKASLYQGINEEEVHSCMGVPVKVDNRLIGYILIQHSDMNYFGKDHAIFLSLIGNHIGVAIENNFLYKKIKESASKDGLTDIFNKRYFFETLGNIPNLTELDYCIVMIDLDNFKLVNDTYGHPMGDIVLQTFANIIKKDTRTNDIVARYGGDEIIIFINNFTDLEKVKSRIELMRQDIEQTVITNEDVSVTVTASFGVYIKQNEILSLDEAIKKADEIMYLSKNNGKNKATIG